MNNIAALALTLSAKPYLFHTSHTSLQKDFTHRVHVTAGVFPRQFSNGAAAHNPTRMAHSDSPFPIPETFFSLTLSAKPSGTVLLSIGLQCRGVYSTVPARVHGPTYGTLSSVSSMHATPCTHTTRHCHNTPCSHQSDHAVLHPQLDRRAAVRAYLHQLRARAARALVAARRGEVRLRVGEAHDARGLASDARLGNGVAAGEVAHVGERAEGRDRLRSRLSAPKAAEGCGRRRCVADANAL